jgi:hypothetical protein
MASGDVVNLADKRVIGHLSADGEVIKVGSSDWLLAGWEGKKPVYDYVCSGITTRVAFPLAVERFFRAGDRLFAVSGNNLVGLQLYTLGKPTIATKSSFGIRPNSTSWFDSVAVQDVFGNAFLVLPTETGMVQPRVKELDGASIVSAKASGRFAAFIVLEKSGDYRKIELTFDKIFSTYTAWTGGTDTANLNMAMLTTGVVVTVVTDGELVIFVPSNGNVMRMADSAIETSMTLASWDSKLLSIKDGEVWRISTN